MKNNLKSTFLPKPIRMKISKGWGDEGRIGTVLGWIFKDQLWAIIVWDGEEDPETFKLVALETIEI